MTGIEDRYWQMVDLNTDCFDKRRADWDHMMDVAVRAMRGELTDVERQVLEAHAQRNNRQDGT